MTAEPHPELLAELDRLEAESNARRAELRRLAAAVPAVMSRRALLRGAVEDLRRSQNKVEMMRRGASRLARAPLHAGARVVMRARYGRS